VAGVIARHGAAFCIAAEDIVATVAVSSANAMVRTILPIPEAGLERRAVPDAIIDILTLCHPRAFYGAASCD
jgi:hypothetical protein